MDDRELIPHLFRTEYRKIISVLCRHFGFDQIEIAEDIASDTFLTAAENWGQGNFPANPTAWLYNVAKNKARNYLQREFLFENKISKGLIDSAANRIDEIDLSPQNINDSQLQMMFTICHPAISAEAQIGLSLRILCGFGIDEIADAFLTGKETVNKRLFRAKKKLREEKIKIEFPAAEEINKRLETVLKTIYLLFSEGYYSETNDKILRRELCLEAIRLCFMLVENKATNIPAANALLSLMCFHSSRFEARVNERGEPVLYEEQDAALWDTDLIRRGEYFLHCAATGNSLSKYHLEAAIAYWHTHKADTKEKWESILQLYNQLLQIEYSPIAALNRTYALSKVYGKRKAIVEAEKLKLIGNHLYFTLLGELYSGIDNEKAKQNFQKAFSLAKTQTEKQTIQKKITKLQGTYKIEIASLDKNSSPGRYEIKVAEILSAEQYAKLLAEKRVKQQVVIKWLSNNAIPLKSIEAGRGFNDLQPLKKVLKNVQVVGLGEATHGTREFFQFKHRMLEFLVKEMGFRVFAMELDFAACQKINDYVMGKTAERTKIILKPWDTEEVLAMIDWMRTYNAAVPENKKVKFVGFDGQDRESGKDKLLDYLKRVAPERAAQTEEFFKDTTFPTRLEKDKARELQSKYVELFMFFDLNGISLINKSTKQEYEQMREISRALTQTGYMYSQGIDLSESVSLRDSYMAENFRRIADREPAGTKFVIWAHNGHVETAADNFPRMGYYLRQFYGDKYYALGFSFNQGSFQAWDQQLQKTEKFVIKPYTVNAAQVDSTEWYFAQTKIQNFLIDFRAAAKNESGSEWLGSPHQTRSIGAYFDNNSEKDSYYTGVPSREFDGMVFINTTTRARPSQSMKDKYKE